MLWMNVWHSVQATKLANVLFTYELQRRYGAHGIQVRITLKQSGSNLYLAILMSDLTARLLLSSYKVHLWMSGRIPNISWLHCYHSACGMKTHLLCQ